MIYRKFGFSDLVYVKSQLDNNYYLVRNVKDKQKASNLLSRMKADIFKLNDHLMNNINSGGEYQNNKEYILQLNRNIQNVDIRESSSYSLQTSYTVNKGESIIFCIRSKDISKFLDSNNIHDYNTIMYVALHEIAHVACPEYGHTPLFNSIFRFFCQEGIKIGIYERIDFKNYPIEYCGMTINDSII